MTKQETTERIVDVREIAPRVRHDVIFQLFENLPPGASLQIVNDHEPKRLNYQFEDRLAGQFLWSYLEQGPDLWRVRISRR